MTFSMTRESLEDLAMERISHLVDRAHHLEFTEKKVYDSKLLLREAKDLASAMDGTENMFAASYWRDLDDSKLQSLELFYGSEFAE